ncbi:MAG: hypothetical protein K9W44_05325 [Candidatus Lokiarchaeota archaeon]|nr:hypothetical protein [Candidatus Harpocratesius repetitus]
MVWHEILFSICVGSLIAGILLVSLLLFLSATSLSTSNHIEHFGADSGTDAAINDNFEGDHSLSSDHDISSEHEFTSDHDISSEHEFTSDHDISSEHEFSSEHDFASDFISESQFPEFVQTKGKTPLSLKFSLFLLWFGAIGIFLYDYIKLKEFWIILTILLSFGISIIITKFWSKIARNTMYRVRLGNELIGRQATVKIPVSKGGGVISVNTYDAVQTLAARSLHPLSYFYPGDQVYICIVKDGMYLVDDNPESARIQTRKFKN